MSSSRGSSRPRDQTHVSYVFCISRRVLYHYAIWEATTISQGLLKLCQLSWWWYPIISSSATRFTFCLQSFPASGSFPMCQLFTAGGQSIGAGMLAHLISFCPPNNPANLPSVPWFLQMRNLRQEGWVLATQVAIVVIQSLSHVSLFATPWTAACQTFLSFTVSRSLLKLMSIESVMPSNHPVLCCPLLLMLSVFASIRVFSNEWLFASGGQNIGASASASVLPMNIQDWSPLEWTGWISLQSKGLSRVFSSTTVQNHRSETLSLLCGPSLTSIHDHWENHSFDERTFVGKLMSLF